MQVFDPLLGTGAVHSGGGSISFDVPDHPVLVEIGGSSGESAAAAAPPAPSVTPAASDSGTQITASDARPVIVGDGITATASSGDHMIFLTGTGDTLTATGGTETVQAYQGGNSITTGGGDDTIRYAGSGKRGQWQRQYDRIAGRWLGLRRRERLDHAERRHLRSATAAAAGRVERRSRQYRQLPSGHHAEERRSDLRQFRRLVQQRRHVANGGRHGPRQLPRARNHQLKRRRAAPN